MNNEYKPSEREVLHAAIIKGQDEIERAAKIKKKFDELVLTDGSHYALSWSDNYFASAATEMVWRRLVECKDISDMIAMARRNVRTGSMFPTRSTSGASNLMASFELESWAHALDWLEAKVASHA